jgi:hypothetical protein
MPPVQTPLWQSMLDAHARPSAHFFCCCTQGPPQSVSVSAPFFFVSVQLGAGQTPPEQTSL